jgi:hypothetical protein
MSSMLRLWKKKESGGGEDLEDGGENPSTDDHDNDDGQGNSSDGSSPSDYEFPKEFRWKACQLAEERFADDVLSRSKSIRHHNCLFDVPSLSPESALERGPLR